MLHGPVAHYLEVAMAKKAWVRNTEGPAILRLVDFTPRWGPLGELSVHQCSYWDGDLRFYGTGTAVAELRELPIMVRVPFLVARGRMLWVKSGPAMKEMAMALRKIGASATGAAQGGPGLADRETWAHILEYLTETKYPDGSAREPSSLIIVADTSGWRGCVSDKDNQRTMWKAADSVEALLNALEEALASDDPTHWRQSSAAKWKGKKRS